MALRPKFLALIGLGLGAQFLGLGLGLAAQGLGLGTQALALALLCLALALALALHFMALLTSLFKTKTGFVTPRPSYLSRNRSQDSIFGLEIGHETQIQDLGLDTKSLFIFFDQFGQHPNI